jgi:aminoglycoside phosphotransferase (APT) family kinase protein
MVELRVGEGRTAEVFDRGDHVVKLYRPGIPEGVAQREMKALQVAFRQDVSAPRPLRLVRDGGRWGLAMTRLHGPSLGSILLANPDRRAASLKAMARLQAHLHSLSGEGLPSQKERLRECIEVAPDLPADLRRNLLRRLTELPSGNRLCHGDFHPFNLVVLDHVGAFTELGILDWLDATAGAPEADACRTLILLDEADENFAADWLADFLTVSGLDASLILSWRPVVAAARLAEGFEGQEAAKLRAWADEV